jgi:hypothetical protein
MVLILAGAILIPVLLGAWFILPFTIVFDIIVMAMSIRIVTPNTVKLVEFL